MFHLRPSCQQSYELLSNYLKIHQDVITSNISQDAESLLVVCKSPFHQPQTWLRWLVDSKIPSKNHSSSTKTSKGIWYLDIIWTTRIFWGFVLSLLALQPVKDHSQQCGRYKIGEQQFHIRTDQHWVCRILLYLGKTGFKSLTQQPYFDINISFVYHSLDCLFWVIWNYCNKRDRTRTSSVRSKAGVYWFQHVTWAVAAYDLNAFFCPLLSDIISVSPIAEKVGIYIPENKDH